MPSTPTDARLSGQRITRHDSRSPADLVRCLGAVQAQDYGACKWAVGLRLPEGATDSTVERAIDVGNVLRLHVFRFTWQLVHPADARWMLALVTPRLMERAARRHRELDLDARAFRKADAVIEQALLDASELTRDEIGERLSKGGVSPAGQRLAHILACAELRGLIASGARRGKQSTYTLFERRVPPARQQPSRDECVALLAQRYFSSRGPATLADFAWWSGLPPADARAGQEAIRNELVAETIGGRVHFRSGDSTARSTAGAVYLLPAFDEYLVSYRDRNLVLDPKHAKRLNAGGGMLSPAVVVDGRFAGTWRRVLGKTRVNVEVRFFSHPTSAEKRSVVAAARRYGAFLGLDSVCDVR